MKNNIPDTQMGLGWMILKRFDVEILHHEGTSGGYFSFVGLDKDKRKGVVVLSNSCNDIRDIGLHLLNSRHPVRKPNPPKERKAIELDIGTFDSYTGEYEITSAFILRVSRIGKTFLIQKIGQKAVEMFAETETDFFLTETDALITFVKDSKGQVTGLVLHQDGNREAKKIKQVTSWTALIHYQTKRAVNKYHVPNLDRALVILELLARCPAGMSRNEIAAASGCSTTMVYRIVMTLTQNGFLFRDETSGRYRLSSKLLDLGCSGSDEHSLPHLAWPEMTALRDTTNTPVMLGTLYSDTEGLLLETAESNSPIRFCVNKGFRTSSLYAGAGWNNKQ